MSISASYGDKERGLNYSMFLFSAQYDAGRGASKGIKYVKYFVTLCTSREEGAQETEFSQLFLVPVNIFGRSVCSILR